MAVVEIREDGEAFEVEFCDNSGATRGLHTLRADQPIAGRRPGIASIPHDFGQERAWREA